MFRVDDGVPREAGVVEEAAGGGRGGVALVLSVPRGALIQERAVPAHRTPVLLEDLEGDSINNGLKKKESNFLKHEPIYPILPKQDCLFYLRRSQQVNGSHLVSSSPFHFALRGFEEPRDAWNICS